MLDIGWWELMVIAVIAVIVVGPRDLPRLMRTVGQWVARARAMAREFQQGFDDLARETELEDLRREVAEAKRMASLDGLKESIDPFEGKSPLGDLGNVMDPNLPDPGIESTAQPTQQAAKDDSAPAEPPATSSDAAAKKAEGA